MSGEFSRDNPAGGRHNLDSEAGYACNKPQNPGYPSGRSPSGRPGLGQGGIGVWACRCQKHQTGDVNQFEIWSWQPPRWPEPHPAVIVSHPSRAANKDFVEVILCSTQRATRRPAVHEVILDQADGLNWPTLCKCDLIYALPRTDLKDQRGAVTLERRRAIVMAILAAHGWAAIF